MFLDEIFVLAAFGRLAPQKTLRHIPDMTQVFCGRFGSNPPCQKFR
ncbi:MAG: hypothetical protein HUU55_08970 [Myxococcales bacterium]|nr:hypothetical protein [Myxococcales bacterium]